MTVVEVFHHKTWGQKKKNRDHSLASIFSNCALFDEFMEERNNRLVLCTKDRQRYIVPNQFQTNLASYLPWKMDIPVRKRPSDRRDRSRPAHSGTCGWLRSDSLVRTGSGAVNQWHTKIKPEAESKYTMFIHPHLRQNYFQCTRRHPQAFATVQK